MKNIKKAILSSIIIFTLILSTYIIIPTNAGNYQTPISINAIAQPNDNPCDCSNIKFLDDDCVVLSSFPPLTKEDLITSNPYPQPSRSFDSLPSYFNWKDNGGDWTSPAKNQGPCGSCWAFSAIGALEAAINIASHSPGTDIDLSEQYVLSCLSSAGDCTGGWMHLAMKAIYSTNQGSSGNGINGCTIESCMPYRASDNVPCSNKCDDWAYINLDCDSKFWQIQQWGWTSSFSEDNQNDWNTMKTWLMDYGPLSVDIYVSNGFYTYWDTHHNENNIYQRDDSGTTNHGVVLLGWKDDYSVSGGGYWICKNSWHPNWGYSGNFFNVAYGCLSFATRCCTWVTTPEWLAEDEDYDHQYVSSSFSFKSLYPKPEDIVNFKDESSGPITLWEWDFDGDNITDSNRRSPSHAFSTTGEYPVKLTVWNEIGLSSTCTRTVTVKTTWPPIAMIRPEYYACNNPKVKFDGTLSWDVDGYITQYEWNMDNGDIIYGPKPTYTFPDIGKIYNVTLTVTDDEGNTGTTKCDIRIDINIPPTTTLDIGYGNTKQRYFKRPVTAYLIADDWSDIKNSYYRVNPTLFHQNFITYSEPIKLYDEGIYNIDFYSTDIYNNQEETKSEQIILDFTPPTLNTPDLSGKLSNGCYKTPVTISLSGIDEMSGIDKISYIIDDNETPIPYWNEYNNSFSIAENGVHTFYTCATDKAGNIFTSDPLQIKIDIEDYPSVNITNPNGGTYIRDKKIFSFPTTSIILGDITITSKVELPYDDIHLQPKHAEFYIDDILCYTDTTLPFEWLWHGSSGMHTIIVKLTVNGYTTTFKDETTAFRLI